jgi:hypothetical protein
VSFAEVLSAVPVSSAAATISARRRRCVRHWRPGELRPSAFNPSHPPLLQLHQPAGRTACHECTAGFHAVQDGYHWAGHH